jgi:hypothetical protein
MLNRGDAETQRENQLTEKIIGCAIEVHKSLGPGLLESAYEECFCYELNQQGLSFDAQLLTYLKLYKRPIGLLMNFNVPTLKSGIKRLVNQFQELSAPPRLGGE